MTHYSLRDIDRMGDRFLDPPEDTGPRCARCGEEGASIPDGTYPLGPPPALCDDCRRESDIEEALGPDGEIRAVLVALDDLGLVVLSDAIEQLIEGFLSTNKPVRHDETDDARRLTLTCWFLGRDACRLDAR